MKDHSIHHTAKGNFRVNFSFAPKTITIDKPVKLSFQTVDSVTNKVVVLQSEHEKDMHLLIVNEDLSYFSHEHPHQVDDQYVHTHQFPHAGNFILFVDYSPQGSGQHVSRHKLKVEGKPIEPKALLEQQIVWQEDGYKLFIPEYQLPIKAYTMLDLTLIIEKDGKPVKDLDYYLGSLAHVVIINENTEEYLHVHPLKTAEKGPEIKLHTSFPNLDKYKMFIQFKHQGMIHTASIVLEIDI